MFQVSNLFNFIFNSTWEEIIASISFVYSSWVETKEFLKTNKQTKRQKQREGRGSKEKRRMKKAKGEASFEKKAKLCGEASCGEISPH